MLAYDLCSCSSQLLYLQLYPVMLQLQSTPYLAPPHPSVVGRGPVGELPCQRYLGHLVGRVCAQQGLPPQQPSLHLVRLRSLHCRGRGPALAQACNSMTYHVPMEAVSMVPNRQTLYCIPCSAPMSNTLTIDRGPDGGHLHADYQTLTLTSPQWPASHTCGTTLYSLAPSDHLTRCWRGPLRRPPGWSGRARRRGRQSLQLAPCRRGSARQTPSAGDTAAASHAARAAGNVLANTPPPHGGAICDKRVNVKESSHRCNSGAMQPLACNTAGCDCASAASASSAAARSAAAGTLAVRSGMLSGPLLL